MTSYCGSDALISTSRESDLIIFTANSGFRISLGYVKSDDPRIIFTSLTGRQMCAVVERTGTSQCGIDGIVASDLRDDDEIRFECPGDVPPQPVAESTIPILISTNGTGRRLLLQVGCEAGGPCLFYTAGEGESYQSDYPMLKPMLRFRVRIFAQVLYGPELTYAQWQVGFSNGPKETYYQLKGEWLEVFVPSDATSIEIYGDGHDTGSIPEEEAGTVS
jgi:hypothetical protein